MSNTKYFTQAVKTGTEILEYYKEGKSGCLLTAQCQSGKTGAVLNAMEQIAIEEQKVAQRVGFIYLGPSSRVLLEQANERIEEVSEVFLNLLGSKTYHAPNLLESRKSRQDLEKRIRQALEAGWKIVVVLDEAHIGIGETSIGLQTMPSFFDKALKALPYLSDNPSVFTILVTATPFTYDHFSNTSGRRNDNFPEVYMEPGNYYYGVKSAFDRGNLKPSFNFSSYRRGERYIMMEDFKEHLRDILSLRRSEVAKGYFIFRATSRLSRSFIKEVCDELGISFQTYSQGDSNIKQFADELKKPSNDFRVMVIIQSYGAGKSLCRENIVGWYETNTQNGRHHADEYQSLGRNFGYNDPAHRWPSYPIYCNMEHMYHMVEYFDRCEEGDFEGKRKIQCGATHSPIRRRRRSHKTDLIVRDTAAECYRAYQQKFPHHNAGKFTLTCTKANTLDVAMTVNHKSVRRAREGRINILYLDGCNANFPNSWSGLDKTLVGKYVIVYELDVPNEVDLRGNKSFLRNCSIPQ